MAIQVGTVHRLISCLTRYGSLLAQVYTGPSMPQASLGRSLMAGTSKSFIMNSWTPVPNVHRALVPAASGRCKRRQCVVISLKNGGKLRRPAPRPRPLPPLRHRSALPPCKSPFRLPRLWRPLR